MHNTPVAAHTGTAGEDTMLGPLLKKLHDSIMTYRDLERRSSVAVHKQFACRQIAHREACLQVLRAELKQSGSDPASGTLEGIFLRVQKDFDSLLPHAERRMLDVLDTSETSLRAAYLRALEQNPASADLREKLQLQQSEVGRAQAELTSLRQHARHV